MAFKQDTFWEDHPPIGGEGPFYPGLRTYDVFDWKSYCGFVVSLPIALAIVFYFFYHSFPSPVEWGLIWLLLVATLPLNALQRYRLYDDNSATPEFDGRPQRVPALIAHVAHSERLMGRLGPPESDFRDYVWYNDTYHSIVVTLFLMAIGIAVMAVAFVAGAVLLFPTEVRELPFMGLYLLLSFIPLLGTLWLRRRVRAGVKLLGTGEEGPDKAEARARWKDVSGAALRWDWLLGQPYLLLELHGATLRYYSPAKDPLHLLRIAKYRLPNLRVGD